jgi:hypothetical protein
MTSVVSRTTSVTWLDDFEQACKRAREQGRLVLLDFFSPT